MASDHPPSDKGSRPLGISILANLHLWGGVIGLLLTPLLALRFATSSGMTEGIAVIGGSRVLIILGYFIVFGLAVASGLGMKRGCWWGWHLGAFYYVYNIARNAGALVDLPLIFGRIPPEELEAMERDPAYYVIKYAGRTVVHSLIYLYFFKPHVRGFFGIPPLRRWSPFLTHTVIYLVVATLRNLLTK